MTNLVGTTLGQYQIVELIGEGGMASVYKAWQPSLRRYVALKVLAPHLSGDAEFVQRFHQEAVSAANLKQTNIVIIHDVGTESGYHYIAMEFVEGASLEQRIRAGQAFTPEQVVDVVSQIGTALDYAHQRGFIHRDIKPANILIDASGRAVLTDFGIVKALSGSGVTSALTRAGTVFGTPEYMSPEQIRDEPLDHRSDLYALGIVCYEMLAGQVPFDGATTHAVLYAQVNTPPPPLRQALGPAAPPPVEAVVNKMLEKERANRYNSGGEFARDLAQAVSGIWPAGVGGGTVVATPRAAGTAVMGGAPAGMPAATVVQPMQPAWPPTPPPMPAPVEAPVEAPARRRRWPLVLGVTVAAVGAVLILGAVVGVLVLGLENPLESIQAALALRRAQEALDAGDYAEAADEYGQVLEDAPDNAEAIDGQLEVAANLAQAGELETALAAYESVWEAKPGEVQALRGLGQVYEAKGEWEEATGWYEKWTQAAPEDGNAFLALGRAHFSLDDYPNTVADYERADALGASSAEMDTHLGLGYYELAAYDKAVERLPSAVEQNPEDFQLRRALGVSLYATGQPEQAAEHLNRAVELGAERPGDELVDVYYALGGSYFGVQDYGQAISFYEQAHELDPEGQAVWAEEAQANLDEAYPKLAQRVMEEAVLDLDFSNIVTEGEETYAIARTGQRARIEGPVRLVDGPWDGVQALVVEERTENAIRNPSVEVDMSGWAFYSVPSYISRSNDRAYSGYYSIKVSGTNSSGSRQTPAGRSALVAASGEEVWTASAYVWIDDDNAIIAPRLYIEWLDASQTRVGISSVEADCGKVNGWQRIAVTATAPASTAFVRVFCPYIDVPDGMGVLVYYDAIQLEQKSFATTYCDGGQGGGYHWRDDSMHNGTSTRAATRVYMPSVGAVSSLAGSISVWWQPGHASTVDYHRYLFDLRDGTTDWGYLYWDYEKDAYFFSGLPGNAQPFSAGDWQHVVVIWESESRKIYVNDVLEASDSISQSSSIPDTLYVGVRYSCSFRVNGLIAEFVTFDRALTAGEVAALYRKGMSAGR